jgi:thiol:disulfide interchange protein DsbG
MKRLLLAFAILVLFQGNALADIPVKPLSAAVPLPTVPVQPDPSVNPVLANIQKMGAKLFFIGAHAGMNGWFIVKDGQVQIAYATPDNKAIVIGAMFAGNGDNITAMDVATLVQNNKEIGDLIAAAQTEQAAIAQVGSPAAPVATPSLGSAPATPLSPGERLIHDLSGASTVIVGNVSSPEILMVMDPRCSHCQATWKALRDIVIKGGVHVRMIPMADMDTENERAAAILLGLADPLTAWDKFVSGDKSQLAGTPSSAAVLAVRSNRVIVDNWKITDTPYLVYRAKDGKVKVVKGSPEDISVVLHDLGL